MLKPWFKAVETLQVLRQASRICGVMQRPEGWFGRRSLPQCTVQGRILGTVSGSAAGLVTTKPSTGIELAIGMHWLTRTINRHSRPSLNAFGLNSS